jgi:uncharacterized membrane protein YhaH (DUF805 family)
MTRRAFIGWWVLVIVGQLYAGIPIFAGAALGKNMAAPVQIVMMAMIITVLAIAGLWITCCLQAKRLRDIGLPPLPVIAALTVISLVDMFVLTGLTSLRFVWPFLWNTPIGGSINAVYYVALMFWPSAEASSEPTVSGAGPLGPDAGLPRLQAIATLSWLRGPK